MTDADDVERDVLRQDHDAAAAGDGLGHPLPGDGGHVRDDDGDRGADAVGRGEVDVEARPDGREAGHHEHVVVGEVVTGIGMEQAHRRSPRVRSRPVKVMSTGAHLRCFRVRCRRHPGRPRARVGRVVRGDVAAQRVHRAAGRRRAAGDRRRPPRSRRRPQAARPGGVRRPDGTDRGGPARGAGRRGRLLPRRAHAAPARGPPPGRVPPHRGRRDRPQRLRAR